VRSSTFCRTGSCYVNSLSVSVTFLPLPVLPYLSTVTVSRNDPFFAHNQSISLIVILMSLRSTYNFYCRCFILRTSKRKRENERNYERTTFVACKDYFDRNRFLGKKLNAHNLRLL
jgi:hypothetical protein